MAKINQSANFSNSSSWENLMVWVARFCQDAKQQINGNLTFQDNISNKIVGVTFTTAFSTVIVPHGLGRTPQMWLSGSFVGATGVISETRVPDNNNIYLAASSVCGAKILVI